MRSHAASSVRAPSEWPFVADLRLTDFNSLDTFHRLVDAHIECVGWSLLVVVVVVVVVV